MVTEAIEKLSQKGVNVTEIEQQTKATEDKIEELNLQIEKLPKIKEELIVRYKLEKEEQLKIAENRNYVIERETENFYLFVTKEPFKTLITNHSTERINITEKETEIYAGRKR